MLAFPGTRDDDQVGALSQLINWTEPYWQRQSQIGGIGPQGIVPAGQIIQIGGYDAWPRDDGASVWG